MAIAFKCNNQECELYPCFFQGGLKTITTFGDTDVCPPSNCAYFDDYDHQADWEEVPMRDTDYFDDVWEFIEGKGYENLPSWFEELFYGNGIRTDDNDSVIAKCINLLSNKSVYPTTEEKAEFNEFLKKMKKEDIIKAVFPMAFRMGLAYGEYLRQTDGREYEELHNRD